MNSQLDGMYTLGVGGWPERPEPQQFQMFIAVISIFISTILYEDFFLPEHEVRATKMDWSAVGSAIALAAFIYTQNRYIKKASLVIASE